MSREKVLDVLEKSDESKEDAQYINFSVKIYKADGIPRMDSGIIAQVKRTFSVEAAELLNPYVEVFLAGLKGTTEKKKRTLTPCWNQQIIFTLKFPLPSHPLVVQIRDDEVMMNKVVGTAIIQLDKISNSDSGGFLPTFGPSYVYLKDSRSPNGTGIVYKGRLLMALSTEIISSPSLAKPYVTVESIPPLPEGTCGLEVHFLLFACIRDVTMIEKKVAEKPLRFTLQIGHIPEYDYGSKICCGNRSLSLASEATQKKLWNDGRSDQNSNEQSFLSEYSSSFMTPVTTNRKLYNLPICDRKECIRLASLWPDSRRRMYISNILAKTMQEIELCKDFLSQHTGTDILQEDEQINKLLKDFEETIKHFLKLLRENWTMFSTMTILDKERRKMIENNLECLQDITSYNEIPDRIHTGVILAKVTSIQQELIRNMNDPQPALPDVVVWMESDQKRIGYCELAACDLLYAKNNIERGQHCGKIRSLFLKPLYKKNVPYLAKMDVYLWLGVQKHFREFFQMLPRGFDSDTNGQEIEQIDYIPRIICYYEKHVYQLQAHLYQARFLPRSNMSKFPSPVAQIFVGDRCLSTQIRENTLNPVWDETLVFNNLVFYGSKNEMDKHLPDIIVEIYDYSAKAKSACLSKGVIEITEYFVQSPVLKWYNVNSFDTDETTQILAAFELFFISEGDGDDMKYFDVGPVMPIPSSIRPHFSPHRIEILFWGLRELKRVKLAQIEAPAIELECGGKIIQSSVINNYKRHSNFRNMIEKIDVELPERESYFPALTIRLLDCKSFGRRTMLASHVVHNLQKYVVKPNGEFLEPKYEKKVQKQTENIYLDGSFVINVESSDEVIDESFTFQKVRYPWTQSKSSNEVHGDEEEQDWWSRYHISTQKNSENRKSSTKFPRSSIAGRRSTLGFSMLTNWGASQYDHRKVSLNPVFRKFSRSFNGGDFGNDAKNDLDSQGFIIYPCELENVPEFGGFKEWLHSFELKRGRTFARFYGEIEKTVAIFKGCFRIYEVPLPSFVMDPFLPISGCPEGLFYGLPENNSTRVLIRLYIIEAIDLAPSDVTNMADAYIVVQLGKHRFSDKENYISKQLNPVFGKCFECVANFPSDSLLQIQIMDWDLMGTDDLVGETKIDLENRFYSRHRPTCGLARTYETSGPNAWRDVHTPTEILTNRCQESGLGTPQITEKDIRIANIVYDFSESPQDGNTSKENMALCLLHRWKDISPGKYSLVPEHLETRTLYHPSKPGESQGKLVMWIDMFPEDSVPPNPPRNVSKRKPMSYELRVIIWNTDDVILSDDAFLTGEKMSDIYVKGWLTGKENAQKTDVHYRSLTGEGNFNWRFVFPFEYLPMEKKMVVMKKVTVFSWDETEFKLPAELKLQVFDADHFKADDFLGQITLDLNRFPRGAKFADRCSLDMLKNDGSVPQVSLFKQQRIRGWWPVSIETKDENNELTGKIEAELHLLKKEEAEKSPVGLGRKEPESLPEPKRPETSFINFLHPFKTLRYAFWKRYKRRIIKVLIIAALALIILLFVYAAPGYTAKKIIGA